MARCATAAPSKFVLNHIYETFRLQEAYVCLDHALPHDAAKKRDVVRRYATCSRPQTLAPQLLNLNYAPHCFRSLYRVHKDELGNFCI